MRFYIFFLLIMIANVPSHTAIKDVPVYPSGIKVSFSTNQTIITQEPLVEAKKRRKPRMVTVTNTEKITAARMIRVINSVKNLKDKEHLALIFYDADNKAIEYHIVNKTEQPSPTYIFFMDRQTGRDFQGKLDIRVLPENAHSFTVAIINNKKEIIHSTSHGAYNKNKQILVADFNKTGRKRTMLQFEVLGSAEKTLTRIAAFQF